jgi:tetratricopeptide (TPR) repeat protein
MSSSAAGPPAVRFTQVLRRLVQSEDSRGIIRLVERWLEHGGVTLEARVFEARAFMDFRLMDRAWVRLGEAAEVAPNSIEVQLLTTQLYIERGWPGRARQMLDRVVAADVADKDHLEWLHREAKKSPRALPEQASEIERTGAAEQVLALAEHYLTVGSLVRAESLLERLIRDGYTPARVSNLLWAVRGDFGSHRLSTEALIEELAGDEWVGEWGGHERTEALTHADETAHVDPSELDVQLLSGVDQRAFPALFRRDEATGELTDGEDDEVTMSSMMTGDGQSESVSMLTDPDLTPIPGFGDTKIMEVITRGDVLVMSPVDGPIHRGTGRPLSSTLDLKAHQEELLPPDDAAFLEDEDKDLIVMTRREDRAGHTPKSRSSPIEVMKRSVTPPVSGARPDRNLDHLENRVQREASQRGFEQAPVPQLSPGPEPDTEDVIEGVRGGHRGLVQMGTSISLFALVTALCAWLVVAVLHWIATGQIIQEAHDTIAAGDFRALQELEAKLEGQLKADRSPTNVRLVELALVRTVLWTEYSGDSVRMHAAQDGLTEARAEDAPEDEVALVNGFLRLAMGDLQTARGIVDQLDMTDSLHRDLAARVALRVRGDSESRDLMARLGPVNEATPIMELLSRESLLTALGDMTAAEELRTRLMADHANSPFVQIARFHEQWDEDLDTDLLPVLSDVMESLPGPVAPRQEGRLHAQRAILLAERGNHELARLSWAAALVVDPSHPRYLFVAASERLANNQVLAALDDLDRCLGSRPWDYGCRRGMIQALIELDRLETARQSVEAWKDRRTPVLEAWVSLAEGNAEEALALVEGQDSTLAAWVRGMALREAGSSKASATLDLVLEGWSDIQEPMTQILVGRARVAKALMSSSALLVEPLALEWAPNDPIVRVELARTLEASGQRASAARVYQEAAYMGPESARALHALGMFWFDPRNHMEDARTVWRRYLELQPDGDRARRTRARMGRR